ncbi:MAG: aspartate 1-decarboxylase [Candidatus Zixiibacteriota bacterium]
MLITLCKSKIHRARVTGANLDYVGSLTIDETLMKAANLREYERVTVGDITNGERFDTYVIRGEPDSGEICVNGAAAHKVTVGDLIIIMAYAQFDEAEADTFVPSLVYVNRDNRIVKVGLERAGQVFDREIEEVQLKSTS